MNETIIVAGISFVGTLFGTFGGILTSQRLMSYRIEQLEKKVEKHNSIIERVFRLEEHAAVIDEQIKVANRRLDALDTGQ